MNQILNYWISVIILFLLSGCNDKVFVPEFLPESIDKTMECGDSFRISFTNNNWNILSVCIPEPLELLRGDVYDKQGNNISQDKILYMEGLGRIVYHDDSCKLNIERLQYEELVIRLEENLHESPYMIAIYVGNEDETKHINLTLTLNNAEQTKGK